MEARVQWTTVRLGAGDTLVVDEADETEVFVGSGVVWLTQRGDDRDLMLHEGRSIRLASAAGAVLSAHRGAELRLRSLRPVAAVRPGTWLARWRAAIGGRRWATCDPGVSCAVIARRESARVQRC